MGWIVGMELSEWDSRDMSKMSLGFPQLCNWMDSEIGTTHVWDVPGLPATLGWNGQWDWRLHSGTLRHVPGCPWASGTLGWMDLSPLQYDTWDMSGCPWASRDSGMGLEPSREGCSGDVQKLWDGMESGIGAL